MLYGHSFPSANSRTQSSVSGETTTNMIKPAQKVWLGKRNGLTLSIGVIGRQCSVNLVLPEIFYTVFLQSSGDIRIE